MVFSCATRIVPNASLAKAPEAGELSMKAPLSSTLKPSTKFSASGPKIWSPSALDRDENSPPAARSELSAALTSPRRVLEITQAPSPSSCVILPAMTEMADCCDVPVPSMRKDTSMNFGLVTAMSSGSMTISPLVPTLETKVSPSASTVVCTTMKRLLS
ncbi:hypothetical protein [Breoghania sp.]|uniref:hypothetical protein n=1 Tax=Breoghania sp. TaxID=2065378 RepID=UPI0026030241|nr:hypothetical protein [Breoghania sp.]MDJ0933528.1 hypothetical protein [Breoghania sp.]